MGLPNNFVTREEMHDEQASESVPEGNDKADKLGNDRNVYTPKEKFLKSLSLFFVKFSTQFLYRKLLFTT
jgi:hypothetical protein